ncbi:hypothetical protein Zmor_011324 [Zophobas morio]|uniref:Uncharacterized protein n=1 Tax=Zophobas morio TaxID=2755281 RepID=A0AA38MKB1_9CUCU|nr:hypothetical protein Zmor_011324 [Zophobas morio]
MGSSGLSTALTPTNRGRVHGGGAREGQWGGGLANWGFRGSGICSSAGLRGGHRSWAPLCEADENWRPLTLRRATVMEMVDLYGGNCDGLIMGRVAGRRACIHEEN